MAVTARAGDLIIVGIDDRNLEHLKAGRPFHHHLHELGKPFQLMIFHAPTLADLQRTMQEFISTDTQVIDHLNRKPQ